MKVKDGITGLIIGDALGVPVEFSRPEKLEETPVTGMMSGGIHGMPPGTWSDDSSMALATMASIVEKNAIDYTDIMNEFCEWLYNDKYSQYETFDAGNTTTDAISSFRYDNVPALEAGGKGERNNGNGSLMRILPLAFIPNIDYETIENVSGLTHGHERSKIACVLYIEIAKSMMENDLTIKEHILNSCEKIKKHYEGSKELIHFKRIFNCDYSDGVKASGYVISTFESVLYCLLETDNFRDAVLKAVNLGRDTDTVGAICGGLAGIYYGFDAIPVDWIDKIIYIEKVFSLCERYEAYCDEH